MRSGKKTAAVPFVLLMLVAAICANALFLFFVSSAGAFGDPFFQAIDRDDIKAVRSMLDQGRDASAKNDFGITPLMEAAAAGSGDIVRLLVSKGADVNAQDKDTGMTALINAGLMHHAKTMRLLIDHGADVNAKFKDGTTALMLAAADGFGDIVRLLIKKGADVRAAGSGHSVLDWAKRSGKPEIVRILEQAGAK